VPKEQKGVVSLVGASPGDLDRSESESE